VSTSVTPFHLSKRDAENLNTFSVDYLFFDEQLDLGITETEQATKDLAIVLSEIRRI
jgi:hypothetical protein